MDLIYSQLFGLIIIVIIFISLFFLVRLFIIKKPNKFNSIEQRLDRIIDLLEKDNKE
ncbi:DUF4083 domain-containing protein [Psychrobacillus glaciei]|uniref:DUF4083 domain-containing protein n=1 Tax=Psychrobacillus glaciei TaxID=2283160 RepID=A0A5J6SVN6_9BACI|nr:DUF4083 domain-containing protein [Psychrobacillus glaciei]